MASPSMGVSETWPIIATLASILLVVLGAYGTLLLSNRRKLTMIYQRLFGNSDDDTDTGFVSETTRRVEHLDKRFTEHADYTEQQMNRLDRKLNIVVTAVSKETDALDPDEIYNAAEPPDDSYPPENMRGPIGFMKPTTRPADADDEPPASDGGRPRQPPENSDGFAEQQRGSD